MQIPAGVVAEKSRGLSVARLCLFTARGGGLAGLTGTPEGPAASPAPALARDGLPGESGASPGTGESEGSDPGMRGQKGKAWGKVRVCKGSCKAPRPQPNPGNRSPEPCGAFLPRAFPVGSLWVPDRTKIMDFITREWPSPTAPEQSVAAGSALALGRAWLEEPLALDKN